jgi:RsmE family RNA methyltransferase
LNIVLFDPGEIGRPLEAGDARAAHVIGVLKRKPGETFDAGVYDGDRGKGRVIAVENGRVVWAFEASGLGPGPELDPIELVVGLPRPQTARKILQEATALGVRALRFAAADKAEAGYARSTLWTSGEWRRHVRAGIEQAFSTRVPRVAFGMGLGEAIGADAGTVVALDNYEADAALGSSDIVLKRPVTIAVGAERGWSARERDLFRSRGAALAHLGPRVLRTETACVAAFAVVKARLGLF